MSQTNEGLSGNVGLPDLQHIVVPLSRGVQEAMNLLYRLQKNSLDLALRNEGPHISYDSLVKSRDIFRADWRSYIALLQQCHTYVRDFTLLCEFASTRSASECSAFSKGMLNMGRKIHEEASRMQAKHQRTYHELRTHTFSGVIQSSPGDFRGVGDRLSLAQFIQNAEASVRADNAKALFTIQDALCTIETSIRDLGVFWKNQVDELKSADSAPDFRLSAERPADLVSRWRRYDAVIVGSISSILESLDAVVVKGSSRSGETRDENQRQIRGAYESGLRGNGTARRRRTNTMAPNNSSEKEVQIPREPREGRQGRTRTKSAPAPSTKAVFGGRESQRKPIGWDIREEMPGVKAKQTAEMPQVVKEERTQIQEANTGGREKVRTAVEAEQRDKQRSLEESEARANSLAQKSCCGCIIM